MDTFRKFRGIAPNIAPSAYVDPAAHVIGSVEIGADSSVWPAAVVRGDGHPIRIGQRTNIQDGVLLHVTHDGHYTLGGFSMWIGDDVTIGHGAVLHGCTIQNGCTIGMNATVLDGTLIKRGALIGAGAVVPGCRVIGEREVWLGNPARFVRTLTDAEVEQASYCAAHYVRLKNEYLGLRATLERRTNAMFDRRLNRA